MFLSSMNATRVWSAAFGAALVVVGCGGESISSSNPGGSAGAAGNAGAGGSGEQGGSGGSAGVAGSAGTSTGGMAGVAGTGGIAGAAGSGGTGGATGDEPEAYAINKLLLGDTTPDGTPSATAWRDYGRDVDGQTSEPTSVDHCQLSPGAMMSVKQDGTNGIDNSFGANIMPVILGLDSGASAIVNQSIVNGDFTKLLQIEYLATGGASGPASFYTGEAMSSPPAWDGDDAWPLACEGMTQCLDAGTPSLDQGNLSLLTFPTTTITNGLWESGSQIDVDLGLPVMGFSLPMKVRLASLEAQFDSSSPPTSATSGMLSGVIDTEELVDAFRMAAGNISTSLCSGPTFDSIAAQLRAASDIMNDGTQQSGELCNGISIGMGFELQAARLGVVNDKRPEPVDPCAP